MSDPMVSLQVRMPTSERDAIRQLAESDGLSLRELLAAMTVQYQSPEPAMPAAMTPELAERVEALESRVAQLEAGGTAPKPKRRREDHKPSVVVAPVLDDLPELPERLVSMLEDAGIGPAWPVTGNEGLAFIRAFRANGITQMALGATIDLTGGALRSGIGHYKDRPMTDEWRRRIATAAIRVLEVSE